MCVCVCVVCACVCVCCVCVYYGVLCVCERVQKVPTVVLMFTSVSDIHAG